MSWQPLLAALAAPPAYLDPGSGSFLIQLVIAGLLGAALAVRLSWGRIKGLFRRKDNPPPDSERHGE
ncbi:MAG TPA: hypothetical protein VK449_01240 [Anaerolineales bacterium]|nr:hypothetical protein [Anaerolineales bacterium]